MAVTRTGMSFDELKHNLENIDSHQLRVGWFEGAHYEDGTSVAYVASIHEYGAPYIPPRPFMRPTVKRDKAQWDKEIAAIAKIILEGKGTAETTLPALGEIVKGGILNSIAQVHQPALKEATIKRKGFAKPLVGVEKQLQHVSYVVEPVK